MVKGHWLGGVGVNHGVTYNFGSAKVCSSAIFETSLSFDKDIWIAATELLCALLHNRALFHWELFSN